MEQVPLKTLLPKKLAQLNNIPKINAGGCAIVAYALVVYIKEISPRHKPEVVFLSNDSDETAELQSGLIESCCHAVVRIGKDYYDTIGKHTIAALKKEWETLNAIPLDQEHTLRCIEHADWNTKFNRAVHVPDINIILNTAIEVQETSYSYSY